jgi:hypothetical protein
MPPNRDAAPRLFDGFMLRRLWIVCILSGLIVGVPAAAEEGRLFHGREIHLTNQDNRTFRIGVTGTTAGYNFHALSQGARTESLPLGPMGYWEKVPDPPSYLRNFDLQLHIENRYHGRFLIEFRYDGSLQDLRYRIVDGSVRVRVTRQSYYPTLVVEKAETAAAQPAGKTADAGSHRLLFFDFNSFDSDLREYYGTVKRMLNNPDYTAYFYYYESTGYESYFFRTYRDTAKLDREKMGLSLEDGTLEYYQRILDHLKSRHGADFTDQIILVTRFGKPYARQLKAYARDIGISDEMVVTVWSYEDVP